MRAAGGWGAPAHPGAAAGQLQCLVRRRAPPVRYTQRVTLWLWIGGVFCVAVLAALWWLDRAPMRYESVPWSEVSGLLHRLFSEMRVGAWAEVAPSRREWVVRLERTRGWRNHLLIDASTTRAGRGVLESFCKENGLRSRSRDARTLRLRVPRTDAAEVGMDLIQSVLVQ